MEELEVNRCTVTTALFQGPTLTDCMQMMAPCVVQKPSAQLCSAALRQVSIVLTKEKVLRFASCPLKGVKQCYCGFLQRRWLYEAGLHLYPCPEVDEV